MAPTRYQQYSQATMPTPQEVRRPQSSSFWIVFLYYARGSTCPPKCRRRASEEIAARKKIGKPESRTHGKKPHKISRLPIPQN